MKIIIDGSGIDLSGFYQALQKFSVGLAIFFAIFFTITLILYAIDTHEERKNKK